MLSTASLRVGLALMPLFAIVIGGCKTDASDKPKPTSTAVAPEPAPSSPPKGEEPTAPAADVTSLVESCEAAGLSAEQCKCAGEMAKAQLDGALLAKLSNAPADDDPKLEGYFTSAEINRTMSWVEDASAKCGIEEIE